MTPACLAFSVSGQLFPVRRERSPSSLKLVCACLSRPRPHSGPCPDNKMSWWGSGAEPTADGAADATGAAAGGSDSDLQQQLDEKQQELEEVQMEVEVLQKNLEMQVSDRPGNSFPTVLNVWPRDLAAMLCRTKGLLKTTQSDLRDAIKESKETKTALDEKDAALSLLQNELLAAKTQARNAEHVHGGDARKR